MEVSIVCRVTAGCCFLLGVACWALSVTTAFAADDGATPAPLDIPPPPPLDRSTLPDGWSTARTLLDEDFDDHPAGSYPTGWRFTLRNPYNQAPDHEVAAVVATQGRGHVLRIRRALRTQWADGPGRGRLRVQYDYYQLPGGDGAAMSASIVDLRERAAPFLDPPKERGAYLQFTWPGGQAPQAGQVSALRYDNSRIPQGSLAANRWHRVVITADLDTNQFALDIDGKRRSASIPFMNRPWFREADQLSFDGREALIDNILVLHRRSSASRTAIKNSLQPPRPLVPAHRLPSHPVIDGRVDEEAWKAAWRISRFLLADGTPAAGPATSCRVGFLDDFLYIGLRVHVDDAHRAALTPQGTALAPGRIDVYLDPSFSRYPYLRLSFDPAGHKEQSVDRPTWMGLEKNYGPPRPEQWTVKTHVGPDHFEAEMQIPWAAVAEHFDLGNGLGGGTNWWGLNVVRSDGLGSAQALAPYFDDVRDPRRFAKFAGLDQQITAPLESRIDLPEEVSTGPLTVPVSLRRGSRLPSNTLRVMLTAQANDGSQVTAEQRVTRRGAEDALAQIPVTLTRPGGWRLSVSVYRGDVPRDQAGRSLSIAHERYVRAVPIGQLDLRTGLNYYTNEHLGSVRARLWSDDPKRARQARITIQNKAAQLLYRDERPVSGNRALFAEIPVAKMPLGRHRATVEYLDAAGTVLAKGDIFVQRRLAKHNEVKIRWDNALVTDGQAVFPLYMYKTNVYLASQLGVNAILGESRFLYDDRPGRIRKLNFAKEAGIRVITSEYSTDFIQNEMTEPSKFWRPILDDGTMLAFYVHDEPRATEDPKPTPSPNVARRTRNIRAMDPYHPTYVCLIPSWKDTCAFAPIVDIVGHDPYASYLAYNSRYVAQSTRMLRAVTERRQPIWQVLQPFYFRASREHPGPSDIRHSIWSAIIHGANGIGLWGVTGGGGLSEDIRGITTQRPAFESLLRTVQDVRRLAPVILSTSSPPRVTGDNVRVAIMTRLHAGRLYAFVLNMRTGPERVVLQWPLANGILHDELASQRRVPIRQGTCQLRLAPQEALILSVDTTGPSTPLSQLRRAQN